MNILIIGNGFDLENNLPTKYNDFLDFINDIKKNYANSNIDKTKIVTALPNNYSELSKIGNIMEQRYDNAIDYVYIYYKEMIKIANHGKEKYDEEEKCQNLFLNDEYSRFNKILTWFFLKGNVWLDYFNIKVKNNAMYGENWIDFEKEISNVIKNLEQIIIRSKKQPLEENNKIACKNSISPEWIINNGLNNECINLKGLKNILETLENDLQCFIDCIEIYMLLINKVPFHISGKLMGIIGSGQFNALLSFNYTNTFINRYLPLIRDFKTCYVHGEAGKNNLILGIGETLSDENTSIELSCIKFKKYFQRIHKKTGADYIKWIDNYDTKDPKNIKDTPRHEVTIFGHSLDITDSDILKYIIIHEHVAHINIYYHNENAYALQIINLIKIIGKETFIRLVGEKKIEFKSQ